MQINPVSNISFKSQIKISIPDKSLNQLGYKKSPLADIIRIADKNNAGIFIGQDVVILNSNLKIKNDLKQVGFSFEEIGDSY